MKKFLSVVTSVILCVGIIASLCPALVFAESAPDYTLKFKNGKFKILVLADCQDDASPDPKMITMIGKALDYEKPDIVVFLGDNIVTTTQTAFKTGLKKLMAPLVSRNIPYAYVYGNHDDQSALISKSFMHTEYKKVGTCLTYDADPDLTGLGNCNLPVMSSSGNDIAFNLWMIDSNTYTDSSKDYYDNVHQDQLDWYVNTSTALERQAGHKVNSIVFQHIIVPEAYNLLVENPNGSKTYNGKTYELTLNSYASGYLGEWPCPPKDNSGELNTMANRGDVLGIVTGHDHKNSFVGTWNGIDLIQTAGMTFESYGDDIIRGYRTITIDENDTSRYETNTVTYTGEAAGVLNPVATGTGVPDEYYYPTDTQFISDVAIGYGSSKKDPAINVLTSSGFTPIDKDLNGGAGGAYIYMGYKLTSNYADSIKALRFSVLGEGGYSNTVTSVINNNNVNFNLVSEGADGIVDLNKNASGGYIYVYYTKDPLAGPAVTSINFDSSILKPENGETATTFSNVNCAAELNAGTGGSLIYCHYLSTLTKVDSSALRSAYAAVSGLNASDYTPSSYSVLKNARDAAKVIIDKLDAEHASTYSQADINSVTSALNTAYSNLAHTVTYKNYNGQIITTETVIHGRAAAYSGIPTKPATEQYNYTFSGWSADLSSVTSHMTVTANFTETLKSYTVLFKNENGDILQTLDVGYGSTPRYTGQTPVKADTVSETYTFAGWSPALSPVTGTQSYTATYTASARKYNIIFKNYNDDVLQEGEWAYGSTPEYTQAVPVRPEDGYATYTFTGWSPEIETVSGAKTYTAQYSSTEKEYTVTFKNGNDIIQTSTWKYGETPEYTGGTPELEANDQYYYEFAGWSPEISEVTEEAVYSAVFTPITRKYNVTFKNYNGDILQESEWDYDATPEYKGQTPVKPEDEYATYAFTEWSPEISTVTGEAVYIAQFTTEYKSYTYRFYVDGTEIPEFAITQAYGTEVTAPVYTPAEGYDFSGWSAEVPETMGTESLDFYGTTTPRSATVTFDLNGGTGTVPAAVTAAFGTSVELPAQGDIKRDGYDFKGWAAEADAAEPVSEFIIPLNGATLYAVWAVSAEPQETELIVTEESGIFVSNEKMQICGVAERTSVKALEAELTVNGGYAEIQSVSRYVGTGTLVNVYDDDGNLVLSYTIIIFGDVDGDGRVTPNDVSAASIAISHGFDDSAFEAAANIFKSGRFDRFDYKDISALMSAVTEEPIDQVEFAQIYEIMG
ncbi:MAG: InlB B-repeat-containing protein [Clostridiales bacterium]|nr:InlB B-repeat-containing protein [Clostridiales bacterium]